MALEGQFDTVIAIIEHNPVEGPSNNITSDVFADDVHQGDDDPADYSSERIDASLAGVTRQVAA